MDFITDSNDNKTNTDVATGRMEKTVRIFAMCKTTEQTAMTVQKLLGGRIQTLPRFGVGQKTQARSSTENQDTRQSIFDG